MTELAGLGDWVRLVQRNLRLLFLTGLVSGVLSLGLAFLLPSWYEATARILPPHEETPSIFSAAGLEAAIRLESFLPYSSGVTRFDVFLAILESDTVARTLIERHDLQSVYKQATRVRTLDVLRSRTRFIPAKTGVLHVVVEDKDPQRAADLANDFIVELDRVFRRAQSTTGRRQREFLEVRVAQSRASIDSLHAAMAGAQTEQGITALGSDLTEAAEAAGSLLGERMSLAVQLDLLDRIGLAHTAPVRMELVARLGALEREIARLPDLGLDLARSIRDLRIQEYLHRVLAEQLEIARVEEVRDTPTVDVLDHAVAPDRRVRPRRGLTALAGALLGASLAFGWVVVRSGSA